MFKPQYDLSIIIPARNEEFTIIRTLESFKKYVGINCEYIVINDQSTDKTERKVTEYIEQHRDVKLFRTTIRQRGFANALKLGFKRAQSIFILPVMADLCDDPRSVSKMYKKIAEGYDIVAGSRYTHGGRKSGGPKLQGILSRIVCISLHYLTGIPTTDVSNSFKIYRKSLLKKVDIPENFGVEISMYITLQAYFQKAKITEVSTYWKGRTEGKTKFNILRRFPLYLRIYLWALKERFKQIFNKVT